jgi:hypothetical protein
MPSSDPSLRYRHTQIGYVTGGAFVFALLLTYVSFQNAEGTVGWAGRAFGAGIMVVGILFSTLTVTVGEETLSFYFGPGFWTRHIPLRDIVSVQTVRNSPWYGWGIRYTPHGWLYNVSGLRAVEVTTEDEVFRVGTDEPDELKQTLERAIAS